MTIVEHTKSMMAWIVPDLDEAGQATFHNIKTVGDAARFAVANRDKLGDNNIFVLSRYLTRTVAPELVGDLWPRAC